MSKPEDDSCGDYDGGHERVGAAVVAGVDTPPILQASERGLDAMALTVEDRIVGDGFLAVDLRQDANGDAPPGECGAEPGGVVSGVAEHQLCLGQVRQLERHALVLVVSIW